MVFGRDKEIEVFESALQPIKPGVDLALSPFVTFIKNKY
jgi:hypothetical protein